MLFQGAFCSVEYMFRQRIDYKQMLVLLQKVQFSGRIGGRIMEFELKEDKKENYNFCKFLRASNYRC